LDSPPWQVRQNCAALLLVAEFPGSYQPRTKKCVGLITSGPEAAVLKYCISCWSWQVVQVTHELLVVAPLAETVPGTLTMFAIGPLPLVTS